MAADPSALETYFASQPAPPAQAQAAPSALEQYFAQQPQPPSALEQYLDQTAQPRKPKRDLSQLGADIRAAGGQPSVGSVPVPDPGYGSVLQAAATSAFGVPLAGAAETVRDALRAHPIAQKVLDPGRGMEDVPEGVTQELRDKAEKQRSDYLEANPGGLAATGAAAGELGVNLLPMLAGAPAALRALGVAGASPTIASAASGALRGAAAGAAIGAPTGYAGSYGSAPGDRLAAAAHAAGLGGLMGAVGGAGSSPAEVVPGAASSDAVAAATKGTTSALEDLAAKSLAIGEDRQSPPAAEKAPLEIRQQTPPDQPRQVLTAHHAETGDSIGQLTYDKAAGGGFSVYDVATGQRGTGAGRALYQAAAALDGPYRGSIIQTPEGEGFIGRLRQTNPEIFGEETPNEAAQAAPADGQDVASSAGQGAAGAGLRGSAEAQPPQSPAADLSLPQQGAAEAVGGHRVGEPPIVQLRREAALIQDALPPVEDGMTRLWRGNRPGEVGSNPQFTNDLPGIAMPFQRAYGGPLSYVDVPTERLPSLEQQVGSAPGAEFILPTDLARSAREVAPAATPSEPAAPPGTPPTPPRPRASEPPGPPDGSPGQIQAERGLYNAGYEIRRQYVASDQLGAQEAGEIRNQIRQAIPDPQAREDATAYLQGTGNKKFGVNDTPADVVVRLEASGAKPAVDQQIQALRPQLDDFHKMVNDLGFQDVPYVKDYIHQAWEPPKDVASPEGISGRGGASSGSPVTRERSFQSFAQGMALGYEPKTLDFADLAAKTHEVYQTTLALHRAMDDVSSLPALPDGNPVVARGFKAPNNQYVDVTNSPIFGQIAKRMAEKAAEAGVEVGEGDHLYLHRQMWTNMRPLVQRYEVNAMGRLYDRLNGLSKQATFAFSLYHPLGSLTPNAIMAMGPVKGITAAAKGGFGVPGLAQYVDRFAWSRPGQEMIRDAIQDGVKIPPPESDVGAEGAHAALGWAAAQARSVPLVGNAAALIPEGLQRLYGYQNEALWSQSGLRAKLAVFTHSMWKQRAIAYRDYLNGNGGSATALGVLRPLLYTSEQKAWIKGASDAQLGQAVARTVAEYYGDQQWQLMQNKVLNDPVSTRFLAKAKVPEWVYEMGDPSSSLAQKVLRRTFTAPDWFASSVKAPLTAASPNPVRAAMGYQYIKGLVGMAVGYNLLNYAMSGRPMYRNPDGYRYSIDMGPQDVNEPEKGHWYTDVGKQEMELPDAIMGKGRSAPGNLPVMGTAFRKAGIFPNAIEGSVGAGNYFSGYPSPVGRLFQESRRNDEKVTWQPWLAAVLKTLGSGFVPIPFKSTSEAFSGGNYKAAAAGLVFPLRKGPTPEEVPTP